jgi:hypothetical protein
MTNYIKIKNVTLFAKSIRKNAVMVFPKSYSDQIDNLISIDQTEKLIQKYIEPGYNNEFLITEYSYYDLASELKKWIYNRSLSQVASNGHIECSWDDDTDNMIFWDLKSQETFNIAK